MRVSVTVYIRFRFSINDLSKVYQRNIVILMREYVHNLLN